MTYLKVDADGIISLDELREAVCEDTILVSMMMVNNEIGAVEPIEEAIKVIKEQNIPCRNTEVRWRRDRNLQCPDRGDQPMHQEEKSEDIVPCRCDPGIWKVPYFSEKTGD